MWDPSTYLKYGDERARPFVDLLARVDARAPGVVVDLGCGPGQLTAGLAARWPHARITGLDSSVEMIEAARTLGSPVRFMVCDVRDFRPGREVEVLISNAALHWVPDHEQLLTAWARSMAAGSWLAFQVPGNFDAPSHRMLRELAAEPDWRDRIGPVVGQPRVVPDPEGYATLLVAAGCEVDAWETTYLHLLRVDSGRSGATSGAHPVLDWMEGTALRPVRTALDPREWAQFMAELGRRLAEAYPVVGGPVVGGPVVGGLVHFPFRRVFCVARVGP